MKIEHYPSLELCKKLEEINFPKTEHTFLDINSDIDSNEDNSWLPCPSVMEMLDVMPKNIEWNFLDIYFSNYQSKWYITYERQNSQWIQEILFQMHDYELPNALAEMIIWLVENKYLKF